MVADNHFWVSRYQSGGVTHWHVDDVLENDGGAWGYAMVGGALVDGVALAIVAQGDPTMVG